jgi:hypothetical protein
LWGWERGVKLFFEFKREAREREVGFIFLPQAPGARIRSLGYAITLILHGFAIPGYRDARARLQLSL